VIHPEESEVTFTVCVLYDTRLPIINSLFVIVLE